MRNESGFTLIEVMMALTILMVVLMGLAMTTARTVHTITTSDRNDAAIQLAHDRIEYVRADPRYFLLDSIYEKTETSFPTLPGFQRQTVVTRTVSGNNDVTRVTVTVTGPGLMAPISRSVTVGAP